MTSRLWPAVALLLISLPAAASAHVQSGPNAAELRGRVEGALAAAGEGISPMPVIDRQGRIHQLLWPLLRAAAAEDLCQPRFRTGLLLRPLADDGDDAVVVAAIAAGSPAADAGLQVGDRLTAIAGEPIKSARRASEQLDAAACEHTPLAMSIRSGEVTRVVDVATLPACPVDVAVFDQLAGALGDEVDGPLQVDASLRSVATDDRQMQILLAHQLGHHLAGHVETRELLRKSGGLLDRAAGFLGVPTYGSVALAGRLATRPGDEAEADKTSLKILAHLNIRPAEVLAFWRAAADQAPSKLHQAVSAHPVTRARLRRLEALLTTPEKTLVNDGIE